MQTIRIGNDITIRATVTRRGADEDFTGKTVRLLLRSSYERRELTFTRDGNVLTALFPGAEQTRTGTYTVTLTEEYGTSSRNTTDACAAFRLVSCSCQSEEAVTGSQTIDLTLDIALPASGLSAYEIALRHGFEGTEQEWLDSVEGNAAAVAALQDGIAASTAATEANAAAISANADSLAALEERVVALEEEADTGRTVGERKCNVYMGGAVIDLGTVAASSVGENWCGRADVCASGARILLYDVDNETTASTQNAIVTNTYNSQTDTALQVLHLGAKAYHRTVTGIQAATDSGYPGDTEKGSWTEIEL